MTITQKSMRLYMALFGLIVVLMTADVVDDYLEGQSLSHIGMEMIVLFCSLTGILLLGRQSMLSAQRRLQSMQQHLQEAQAASEHWQSQSKVLMQGLSIEIQKQFERWGLTQAESEIGLLMLKGFSHQEIAAMRQASERTVREQARAVYRKAGLNSKAALSAFFLEDLLLPVPQAGHKAD